MTRIRSTRRRALDAASLAVLGASLCLLLGLAASTQPAAAAAKKRCAHANDTLSDATPKQVRKALTCLISRKRRSTGRHRVTPNTALKRISQRHAKTMLRKDCLKHRCGKEASIPARLERSGYLDGVKAYGFGENTGCARTAKTMVRSWLQSRYHRRNLLGRRFRQLGVGLVAGAPASQAACTGDGFATFSVLFAWRRR